MAGLAWTSLVATIEVYICTYIHLPCVHMYHVELLVLSYMYMHISIGLSTNSAISPKPEIIIGSPRKGATQ